MFSCILRPSVQVLNSSLCFLVLSLFLPSFSFAVGTIHLVGGALPKYSSCLRSLQADTIEEELALQIWENKKWLKAPLLISGRGSSQLLTFSGIMNGERVIVKVANWLPEDSRSLLSANIRIDLEQHNYLHLRALFSLEEIESFFPAFVSVGTFREHSKAKFVIYKDLRGKDLAEYLKPRFQSSRGLSIENQLINFVSYLREMAGILNKIHSKGALYVDVKPDNFLVDPHTHHLRIVDFESVGFDENFVPGQTLQVNQALDIFNVKFASPEIKEQRGGYTPALDIFALARSMNYFYHEYYGAFLQPESAYLRNPTVFAIHEWMRLFTEKNTALDPQNRSKDMDEVLGDIDELLARLSP